MDASAALALKGVAGYYGASDVPGSNIIGPTKYDEEVFATDTVTCVGQVSGEIERPSHTVLGSLITDHYRMNKTSCISLGDMHA